MKRIALITIIYLLTLSLNGFSQEYLPQIVYIKLESNSAQSYKSSYSVLTEFEIATGGKSEPIVASSTLEAIQKRLASNKSITTAENHLEELKKWVKVVLPFHIDAKQIALKWRNRKGIQVIEPHYIREISLVPNDPIYAALSYNYYEKQRFPQAWDIQKASSDIVIAIVDSGVDYNHPDLKNKLWNNSDEIPDNGIDDDNNGWIDDVKGWDFWQAGEPEAPVQDNDPKGDFSDHGTHVAGIAAAESDNSVGLPGTGFNATFMPVKAGGTQDYSRSIAFGYEAILYAVANKADIINCSWGGYGFSAFEFDIVQTALESGVLIVAASGNEDNDGLYYPSAYPGVLSVGSFESSGVKSNYANYGYDLDVLASGTSIRSTVFNNAYSTKTGTSMASPMVAGLAALVKAQHPDWQPLQIANQIRVTATLTDHVNGADLAGKLGRGYINAEKALGQAMPGYIVTEFELINNQNAKLKPNEAGVAHIKIQSIGESSANTQFQLSTKSAGIILNESTKTLPSLAKNEVFEFTLGLELDNTFNPFEVPSFILKFNDASVSYIDERTISYDKLVYEEHSNSDVLVSMASDGTIGFVDPDFGTGGIGFIPKNEEGLFDPTENLLFSSSILVRYKDMIADRAVSVTKAETDIKPLTFYTLTRNDSMLVGSGIAVIDKLNFPAITFKTRSFTVNKPSVSKALINQYTLVNNTTTAIDSIYVGLYADWDILEYDVNSIKYNTDAYYLQVNDSSNFAGIAPINDVAGAIAIDNTFDGTPTDVDFGIYSSSSNPAVYDGFTKAEKLKGMKAGFKKTFLQEPSDVSGIVYTGPYSIAKNDSISVGFIMAYGKTEQELSNQILASKRLNLFDVSVPLVVGIQEDNLNLIPNRFELLSAYPNPFNPTTSIQLKTTSAIEIRLEVIDVMGRIVQKRPLKLNQGVHQIPIDFSGLASGMYLIRLQSDKTVQQTKVLLLK